MVLWFRGIEQWRSGLGGICSAVLWCSGRHARGGRRGNAKWDGDSAGRQRGGFRTRLRRQDAHGAWPARSGERRWVADTRRQDPEPVGHGDIEDFLKNAIQSTWIA